MYPENEIFREGLDSLADHYKEILTLLGDGDQVESVLKELDETDYTRMSAGAAEEEEPIEE